MRLVRLLPERWQKFIHEALKFGIVGGINTVINYAVFNALALTVFREGQLKATVIATVVATITSYLMNRHWTYRDRPKSALRREYALFFLFNATGLLIELGVLAAAKYGLGMDSLLALNVAKTGGVLLATLFRFWSYRTFVFQPAPAEPEKSTWHTIPRDEWDTMAEMDPVAELAESISELEEAQPSQKAQPVQGAQPLDEAQPEPGARRPGPRRPGSRRQPERRRDAPRPAARGEGLPAYGSTPAQARPAPAPAADGALGSRLDGELAAQPADELRAGTRRRRR